MKRGNEQSRSTVMFDDSHPTSWIQSPRLVVAGSDRGDGSLTSDKTTWILMSHVGVQPTTLLTGPIETLSFGTVE